MRLAMLCLCFAALTSSCKPSSPTARTQPSAPRPLIEYGTMDDTALMGYYRDVKGNELAILAIHNSAGLTLEFADMLDAFVPKDIPFLAVNLFQTKDWATPETASAALQALPKSSQSKMLANIAQGFNSLQEKSAAKKIVIIGWGLGGTWAVKAVYYAQGWYRALVNFYGATELFAENTEKWTTPSYSVVAEKDPTANLDLVASMGGKLQSAPAEIKVIIAEDMQHGFMEPYQLDAYDPNKYRAVTNAAWDFIRSKVQ